MVLQAKNKPNKTIMHTHTIPHDMRDHTRLREVSVAVTGNTQSIVESDGQMGHTFLRFSMIVYFVAAFQETLV